MHEGFHPHRPIIQVPVKRFWVLIEAKMTLPKLHLLENAFQVGFSSTELFCNICFLNPLVGIFLTHIPFQKCPRELFRWVFKGHVNLNREKNFFATMIS